MVDIAVLIPCYNEEQTVGRVIDDFRRALPEAVVFVCDNRSTDRTAETAAAHGAHVLREMRQGKGFAMRRLFDAVEAAAYLMVDGDCTYPADAAKSLLQPVLAGEADMAVGDRISGGAYARENRRAFHGAGNKLVRALVNRLYGVHLHDIMSGYRALSRRFVKTLPVISPGFEIETEMTLHALAYHLPLCERPVAYRDRPAGSRSKLNTLGDGFRVMRMILAVCKDYRPMVFCALLGALCMLAGLLTGLPVVVEYIRTALVSKIPSAILAVGLIVSALLCFACGLILDTIGRHARRQHILLCRLLERVWALEKEE
jgi:glycosyltransferase involved in cell wall biosynthesis